MIHTRPFLFAPSILRRLASATVGLALACASAHASASTYAFTTIAGGTWGSADGVGTAAQFNYPAGVAVDDAGNIYVADFSNSTIRKITPSRVVTTIAGVAGQSGYVNGDGPSARFYAPTGVAVDGDGTIYVADSGNSVVRKITSAGVVTTLGGASGANPSAVVLDHAGTVYFAERYTVHKILAPGVVTTFAGMAGQGGATDGTGSAARFSDVRGITIDPSGNFYVADSGNHTIRKITADGAVTTFAGIAGQPGIADGTASAARFNGPSALASDADGNIYVADSNSHTIRKISPTGSVSTIGGSPNQSGSSDGVGSEARFSNPRGLAVDQYGHLFVSGPSIRTTRPALITVHPTTRVGLVGEPTTFSVEVASATANCQWERNFVPISGATGTTFTIPRLSEGDGGTYTVSVTNGTTLVISDPAILTISTSRYSAPYSFTTVFGRPGITGSLGGTAAKFSNPHGIARDGDGNLYITDSSNHIIRKITPDGEITTLAGTAGSSGSADGTGPEARFNYPGDVTIAPDGTVYVASGYAIRKITAGGVVTTLAGNAGAPGNVNGIGAGARLRPGQLAADASGNVYVSEPDNQLVRKITPGGIATTFATEFGRPHGIVVGPEGDVFVADSIRHHIKKISAAGAVSILAGPAIVSSGEVDGIGDGARFDGPRNLTIDGAGTLYVSDQQTNRIRKITAAGVVTTPPLPPVGAWKYRDGPIGTAVLGSLSDLTADGDGNLYAPDSTWHTVRRIAPDGSMRTIAGHAGYPGSSDSDETVALFNHPTGLTLGPDGALYVADWVNYTVRRISPTGESTIIAGHPIWAGDAVDRLGSPVSTALDALGNVYIGDQLQIRRIDPLGVPAFFVGTDIGNYQDGRGANAWFRSPLDLATGTDGNLYVADAGNGRIRKVTLDGLVTTFAGGGPSSGADGIGTNASFSFPSGVGFDSAGNLFVADTHNHTVRRVTPAGVVTTIAGKAGERGSADGIGTSARFNTPQDVTVDAAGNVFVADTGNKTIRRITPARVVTTVGGFPDAVGSTDGIGATSRFADPSSIVVDAAGRLYVADRANHTIRLGVPAPSITSDPQPQQVVAGSAPTLSVLAAGQGTLSYQWSRDGVAIAGATSSNYTIPSAQKFFSGKYSCTVTIGDVSVTSNAASITVSPAPASSARLLNISTRGLAQSGDNVLIPGFVVSGTGNKKLLIRAVGPTLAVAPIEFSGAVIPDPQMTLKRFNFGTKVYEDYEANDDWQTNANAAAIATTAAQLYAFELKNSREAALLVDLPPGQYTVTAGDKNGASGIAIVELYDADSANPASRLINISNRGFAGNGDQVMIPGFVVSEEGPMTLLVRVVGPTLGASPYNVTGTMADPSLTVYYGQTPILKNDNWSENPDAATTAQVATQVFAFPLAAGSKDAAFVVTLNPGVYTVVGSSAVAGGTGVVLVEVYVVP